MLTSDPVFQDVVSYRLVAQSPNDYFYVAPDSGFIYLRRSVQLSTNTNRYQVRKLMNCYTGKLWIVCIGWMGISIVSINGPYLN